MSESKVQCGNFIRILIENQNKSSLTKKHDIKTMLGIVQKDISALLEEVQQHLYCMGIELVGLARDDLVPITKAEKYFLRKISLDEDKRRIIDTDFLFRKLVTVLSIVKIEGECVEMRRMVYLLSKTGWFDGNEAEYIKNVRQQGYVLIMKENEEFNVSWGWRAKIEFSELDPFAHFKEDY